jgi:bifunctional non-homologous end joining protein LigD
MLATLIDAPFDNTEWVFETKWDGFRLVAKIENGRVTLYSRSGLIVSDNYKPIAKALEKVKKDAVIDGELVALDDHGVSRFQLLQNALNTSETARRQEVVIVGYTAPQCEWLAPVETGKS